MSQWLIISMTLWNGRFHGQAGGQVEWPPSPHRLFQALVAGTHDEGAWGDQDPGAFRWLEVQPPPEILVPQSVAGKNPYRLSVPNNGGDEPMRYWARGQTPPASMAPDKTRSMKIVRPRLLSGEAPTVHFCWAIEDEHWEAVRQHAELLCDRARRVTHFGRGDDFVTGTGQIVDDEGRAKLKGECWVTDGEEGTTHVPVGGALDELDQRYEQWDRGQGHSGATFQRHLPGDFYAVQRTAYYRLSGGRKRTLTAFRLDAPSGNGAYATFPQDKANLVAGYLRHAAGNAAVQLGLPDEFIRWYVQGHNEVSGPEADLRKSSWASYVPIPSIGARKVDGLIRRAMLVDPFTYPRGMPPSAKELGKYLARQPLRDYEEGIVARIQEVPQRDMARDSIFDRYVPRDGARRWGSVTPVVLHGYDRNNTKRAADMLMKQLAGSGYYTPGKVQIQEEAVFSGSLSAGRYLAPNNLAKYTRVHAIIEFEEPIPGPILVGLGRHRGLGVFASLER